MADSKHLQEEFDIALYGAKDDLPQILKLEKILEKFVPLVDGKRIEVVTVEDFKHMSEAEKREHMITSTLLIGLYITPNFPEDRKALQFKDEAIAKTLEDNSRVAVPIYSVLSSKNDITVSGLVGLKGISVPFMLNIEDLKDVDVDKLQAKDIKMKVLKQIATLIEKKSAQRKQQQS